MKKSRYVFAGTVLAVLVVAAVSIMGAVAIAASGSIGPLIAQHMSTAAAIKQATFATGC